MCAANGKGETKEKVLRPPKPGNHGHRGKQVLGYQRGSGKFVAGVRSKKRGCDQVREWGVK